jgi:predicted nucleic acid-binding protein
MAYLLDTNVVSELRKAHKADKKVSAWQAAIPVEEQFISVISLLEIRMGIRRVRTKDTAFADILNPWGSV